MGDSVWMKTRCKLFLVVLFGVSFYRTFFSVGFMQVVKKHNEWVELDKTCL